MTRVRLDEESRIALGAEIGDVVEIEKTKKTVGRVFTKISLIIPLKIH